MKPAAAEVLVYTFKEGALSALAHDLKLEVTGVTLEKSDDAVRARFDARSVRVVCPRKDGKDNPGALPSLIYKEIEKNIAGSEVLAADRYPAVTFASTRVSPTEVVGQLTLHGVTKEIRCTRGPDGMVEARLDQRDFGMKPYSAMFGTLKVKPEVVVSVRLKD